MGINCKFNHTGKARFSSSPASGFDAEAENAVIRKGLFINCECVNNAGMGFVADSGDTEDITFRDCTFWGTTNYAIWGNKPKLKFHDCIIYGAVTNLYDGVSWDDGVQFHNCHFEDKSHPTYGVYTSNDAFLFLGYAYNQFYNCKIVANESKFLYTITPTSPKLFQNCEFINKYDALTSGAWNSSMAGCIFRNCTIRDVVTTTDKYWYVRDELRNVIDGLNIVTPYTLWYYPTITNIGYIPNNEQIKMEKISIKSATGNDYTSSNEIYYRSSVPTTSEESYKKGDVIKLKKPHPCGNYDWKILRTGIDFRLKCLGCGHEVMVTRKIIEKHLKKIISKNNEQIKN
jgi:hypothetical protein